jgi:beta-N-acetylhexosaminidase
MPWISGAYAAVDDSDFQVMARWVDSLQVGGVLVSVGSPFDIAAKLNALQLRSSLPLLVSADLEWGAGMRLTGGTSFPMLMAAGATGDPHDAYTIGAAAGTEGRAAGIHVNFAPDADLNNNPLNPIVNVRSFGENPAAVASLVQAYVRGLQEHGMLATLKHFPGHGDTRVDSHLTLPVITSDYARLDSVELIPFRAGIAAGARVVMSGHIAFPAFTGSDEPATVSAAVMTGLLRDSLGFQGLVVTDALSMGAIASRYGAGEASVRALLAGSDLLVMPTDPDVAVNAVVDAVASGRIAPARLDTSVRRVLEIKRQLGLFAQRTVPLDSLTTMVGTRALQAQADDLAVRSLTLVRDGGPLRTLQARRTRLALIACADEKNSSVGQRVADVLRAGGNSVDYFRLWPMSGSQSHDSARTTIAHDERVVFVRSGRSRRGTITCPTRWCGSSR